MTSEIWLCLNASERALLREALSLLSRDARGRALSRKIEMASALPETVLRVEDGFVEVVGNPNSVRVFDYDCDGIEDDSLSPDREGRPCILREYEPAARQ
jgi:hypothetical protein